MGIGDSMKILKIQSFRSVQKRVRDDLAWYIVYEAIAYAQDALNVSFDSLDHSSLQQSLFDCLMKKKLNAMLSEHVYHEPVLLSDQAFSEAKIFFSCYDHPNTCQLARYLNYLDEWAEYTGDWSENHPVPLRNLAFASFD